MVITGWAFGPGGNRLSRNLPDGSMDPNFHAAVTPSFQSGEIALQDTGKIILAGWVRSPDRTVSLGKLDIGGCFTALTRLNGDGSLDESFGFAQDCRPKGYGAPGPGAFATLRDGSMLYTANVNRDGGIFSEVIHLDSNGAEIRKSALRDALQGFVAISAIVPMSDGRILVGGRSSAAFGRNRVERLLDDGTYDPTFHAQDGFDYVKTIRLHGENILVMDGSGNLHRLNRHGDRDGTFHLPLLKVYSD
jgi:hypothetical protein